jgi:hypothetical protein
MLPFQPTEEDVKCLVRDDPSLSTCFKRLEDVNAVFIEYCSTLHPDSEAIDQMGQAMGFPPSTPQVAWECFVGNIWDVLYFGRRGKDKFGRTFRLPTTRNEWLDALVQQYRANVSSARIEIITSRHTT